MTGQPEDVIHREFSALREALRRYIATCKTTPGKRHQAVMRLEMAMSVAELSAVRGYHRARFEQLGSWDDQMRDMARRSPLLGLPDPE